MSSLRLSPDSLWPLLRALRRLCAEGAHAPLPLGLRLDRSARGTIEPVRVPASSPDWQLLLSGPTDWSARCELDPPARDLLDLYLPVCLASPAAPLSVAHLGQSLDGRIATVEGQSHYVTGPDNILHLHRMRALSDAVIVGASTVELDDPQLTTRLVEGPSPCRVVIDPSRRLPAERRIFRDPAAPTLLICGEHQPAPWQAGSDHLEILELPIGAGGIAPEAIVRALRDRGYALLFVEGGGRTVSRFVEAGAVDRLQLAIAPLIIGDGRPGLALPGRASLEDALRPMCRRFSMGADQLFDCDLRAVRP